MYPFIAMRILSKEEQIQGWSKLYGKPISEEDFKEICDNLYGFFSTIKQWDDEERIKQEDERIDDIRNKFSSS